MKETDLTDYYVCIKPINGFITHHIYKAKRESTIYGTAIFERNGEKLHFVHFKTKDEQKEHFRRLNFKQYQIIRFKEFLKSKKLFSEFKKRIQAQGSTLRHHLNKNQAYWYIEIGFMWNDERFKTPMETWADTNEEWQKICPK